MSSTNIPPLNENTLAKDLDQYFSSLMSHVKMFEAAKTDPDLIELYERMKVIYFLKYERNPNTLDK